jgi:hypothetical protein
LKRADILFIALETSHEISDHACFGSVVADCQHIVVV